MEYPLRTIYLNSETFSLLVEAPFVFFLIEEESQKDALPPSRQGFELAAARTSGLGQSRFLSWKRFFEWEHPFIDGHTKRKAIRTSFETVS